MSRTIPSLTLAGLLAASAFGALPPSDAEQERFLREARIVQSKSLDVGITGSRRLTLKDGEWTHYAHFQDVDRHKDVLFGKGRPVVNFRDSYRFNIAAYRLDRLLDLRMTPVSVKRRYAGRNGSMSWWIDDAMMETERRAKGIEPPNRPAWRHKMHQARLFQDLIYNTDPNAGNILIDKHWTVWLVDFTRSFRMVNTPERLQSVTHVDRRIWDRLLSLDERTVQAALHDVLFKVEIRRLLDRRAVIVRHLQDRMARAGESAILCDAAGH